MLRDFELGFFGPHGYEKTAFSDRHELLALHGSIAMGSEPTLHLHVALGRPDHATIGGHLFGATTAVVNEIQLTRFDGIRFSRRLNEKTGLRELVLE
jgi:predicted DNA-binding protein with PD1-like motif